MLSFVAHLLSGATRLYHECNPDWVNPGKASLCHKIKFWCKTEKLDDIKTSWRSDPNRNKRKEVMKRRKNKWETTNVKKK